MRVIQLIDSFGSSGGLERFVYNSSEHLIKRNHETVIVTRAPSDEHQWGESSFGQIRLSTDSGSWVKEIDNLNPDLIVWHCLPKMVPVVLKLGKAYPIIATVHGPTCPSGTRLLTDTDRTCFRKGGVACLLSWYVHRCGFGKSPISALEAINAHRDMVKALQNCMCVYAVSNAIKNFLLIEGVPAEKIKVFDNTLGAILEIQSKDVAKINEESAVKLLYVGRLVYPKGVQYLLRAMKELNGSGRRFTCEIVGDGWYDKSLKQLVDELGISEYVVFSGRVPGHMISKKYVQSDIVVVPSIWPDPAPLVVPEARQFRKPVVVFESGGLPEWSLLLNGVHVAKQADVHSLANKILEVAELYSASSFRETYRAGPPSSLTERADLLLEIESLLLTPRVQQV